MSKYKNYKNILKKRVDSKDKSINSFLICDPYKSKNNSSYRNSLVNQSNKELLPLKRLSTSSYMPLHNKDKLRKTNSFIGKLPNTNKPHTLNSLLNIHINLENSKLESSKELLIKDKELKEENKMMESKTHIRSISSNYSLINNNGFVKKISRSRYKLNDSFKKYNLPPKVSLDKIRQESTNN